MMRNSLIVFSLINALKLRNILHFLALQFTLCLEGKYYSEERKGYYLESDNMYFHPFSSIQIFIYFGLVLGKMNAITDKFIIQVKCFFWIVY